MTDTNTNIEIPPTIPPLILTYIHDFSQKALTALSIWAMTHGANEFVNSLSTVSGKSNGMLINAAIQIGVGAAGIAASCAWTIGVGYLRRQKMKVLQDAK